MEKRRKKAKWISILSSVSQYTWPLSMCIQNLKILALIEAKELVTENLLGEKEKWTNKAMISSSRLILFYTIQQVIPNICTKFQNPRRSRYFGVRDGKMEKSQHLGFLSHNIWLLSRCIRNLKTLALIEAEKSATENLTGEKEKWTNKGNDKHQEADSLLHNAISHTQHLYQISKF